MSLRTYVVIVATLLFAGLQSCTARHQELLRDRDAEIRSLRGQLSELRSRNDELARAREEAEGRANALEASLQDRPELQDELQSLRQKLQEAEVRWDRGRLSIGIDNTITFDSGSTKLKSSASDLLGRVANVLDNEFADHRIYVEGHTDTDPIQRTKDRFRSNRHLSVERADAVATHLIEKCGVPAERIVVVGYGPHLPRVRGSSESAKARNRRVEVVIGEPLR